MQLGSITIEVTRKEIKHVHLSVHPPMGRVTLVAPKGTRMEVARAYAISRLAWIRREQARFLGQAREGEKKFVSRESHHLWGRRYLLTVREVEAKPIVELTPRLLRLSVRPGSTSAKRAEVIHTWHKAQLHEVVPSLIQKWERKLGVKVSSYFLQRMKTKWGACNPKAGRIRLNTELVKKPKDLLEYVVVHEMVHLLAPTHSERFMALMQKHYPNWREARAELNALPLAREEWK